MSADGDVVKYLRAMAYRQFVRDILMDEMGRLLRRILREESRCSKYTSN